jgi:integrase/recombinase XerC
MKGCLVLRHSVQHELTVLRQLFRWLHAKGVVSANPTTAIRLKRPPRPLPSLVDSDVLSQLLDQPMPEDRDDARLWVRDKAMLELLYGSGLRVSELVGLNMSDIDKAQRLLRITGKGNKTRIVPIGRQAWQALLDYLPHRSLWVEHQDSAVFVSERLGTRLSTRTVQLRIKVQAKRAGIAQDMYPHLLRHCFASHLLSDSGDLRGVQELLGHSDISTTQIYTHLDFGHLSKVYDTAHPRSRRSSS